MVMVRKFLILRSAESISDRLLERIEAQYREEIVRRTWVRRFDIPICRCTQCGKRVQGRHSLQTSAAIGAAAVQVGPEAVALGVLMNKRSEERRVGKEGRSR